MTKTQFRNNTKALKRDVMKIIDTRIEKVIESGCVNFNEYENNYLLPKIFMSAVGAEIEWCFRPLTASGRREATRIKKYL